MFDWGTAIFIELQKFSIYIPFLYFRYISLMSIVGFLHSESGQLELKGGGGGYDFAPSSPRETALHKHKKKITHLTEIPQQMH